MPRRLICTLVALVLLATVPAAAGTPELVVHAGVNASTYDMDDLYEDAREGLALGLDARVRLGAEGFALMPGVWYMQKGFKEGTLWEQIQVQGKHESFTVPVLLSYWFEARAADPRAFIGVAADFVLKSEINRRQETSEWVDVSDEAESLYWSLVLGGGARFFGWLDLEVRYQHGFTPVTNFDYREFDDVIPESQEFDNAYDRTWTLTAGYWF